MKYKAKVVVGVDFPGVGITRKNKETSFEASTLSEAMAKAATFAAGAFPGKPDAYKTYQVSVTVDDGASADKAEPQPEPQPAAAAA